MVGINFVIKFNKRSYAVLSCNSKTEQQGPGMRRLHNNNEYKITQTMGARKLQRYCISF